ncbi:hypothetical protein [Clostridium pasteurianum]|uniref:Uncharacterized protein n=1 Tax=Clostridium pasteurianum BC1 TaxID=86416 RepID=R4KAX2_CLOPA|nr:hypothetical protein [Clostridium pasteurianum]AGK96785.1 hypothetical protein Clopa_1885 [Clostridium pasteurianum BC1]
MTSENEIPKELIVNKVYTSRQIKLFIAFNRVKIMSKDAVEFVKNDLKYKVTKIIKGYVESSSIKDKVVPSNEEKIYIVEKVQNIKRNFT